jgi:arylsulfatase A-like enzyme
MRILALLLCLVGGLLSAAPAKQPNIIFIFSDDHAYQAISAYGDARKLNETPHIDRLARKACASIAALVTNSICGPSRAVILTGKYSITSTDSSITRTPSIRRCPADLPQILQKAGYQTAIIGKWHLNSDPTGFDFWQMLPGQGIYYNPPMIMRRAWCDPGVRHGHHRRPFLEWLANRDKTKPFVLMCQHKAPHREWSPNIKDLGFDGDRVYPGAGDVLR